MLSGILGFCKDACYGNVYRNTPEEFLKPQGVARCLKRKKPLCLSGFFLWCWEEAHSHRH